MPSHTLYASIAVILLNAKVLNNYHVNFDNNNNYKKKNSIIFPFAFSR